MWFKAKRSTVTIGLIVALVVALGLICYLVLSKRSVVKEVKAPRPLPAPTPVVHQPQPQPKKSTVVLFYADWCGHSRQIKPAWLEASQILKSEGYQVLEKEHGSAKDEIMSQGIQGFPTIRIYPQGYPSSNFTKYQGDRSAQSIVNFVHSVN